jgi:hypothetical protein
MNRAFRHHTELFKGKTDFLNEGMKMANNVYERSIDAIQDVEDSVKEYSDKLVKEVKHYPITTALIVGGISALITLLLSKR